MSHSAAPRLTVLIIDDEEKIRHALATMLAHEGFDCITAKDGSAAIHIFAERSHSIAAVTLDLEMPKTDGRETLAMLSMYAPDLPVVIATALPLPDNFFGRKPGARGVGYIQKPFSGRQLAIELRRVIAEVQK